MSPFVTYAHRGASSVAPENTMPAFIEALRQGADAIECDVQCTRDGIPVVIHDNFLERTTDGTGFVHETTYAEMKKLDAGSWFHHKFAGVKVPSLAEVLEWLRSNTLRINIELKASLTDVKQEEIVLDLLEQYRMKHRAVISSYDPYLLQRVRKLDAFIETGYIYFFLHEPWKVAKEVGANALHAYYPFLYEETIHQARAHQIDVVPYTVNEWSDIRRMLRYNIAGIITNYPNRVRKFLTYSPRSSLL